MSPVPGSIATSLGMNSFAFTAGPLSPMSPLSPVVPSPATVWIAPVFASITRTRLLSVSAT